MKSIACTKLTVVHFIPFFSSVLSISHSDLQHRRHEYSLIAAKLSRSVFNFWEYAVNYYFLQFFFRCLQMCKSVS